ncbi:MAG TPA: tripartite tricarboxylate transporter substrate binding protein [Beijerinckiaceae bacterium]|jgi:tripartite-type tricarboxylate transporter receptor subunit TctC
MKPHAVLAAAAVALAFAAAPAAAQDYPTRPIRFVNSSVPGGGADVIVRFIAARVQALAGQPVVVENKPGANGAIANDFVVNAKPDGYTVLFAASSAVIANRYVMKDVTLDPLKELEPVASIFRVGLVLTTPTTSPATSLQALIAHLKSKPGKVLYGVPTTSTLAASELFKALTGTKGEPVAYKSMMDAARDVSSGDIDYTFVDTTLGVGQAKAGRLRVIGTSTARRLEAAPDVPTLAESGLAGYEYVNFWGAWMPAKSPEPAVRKLNAWLVEVANSPEGRKFLIDQAGEVAPSTPQELRDQMIEHDALWRRLVKEAKIEPK